MRYRSVILCVVFALLILTGCRKTNRASDQHLSAGAMESAKGDRVVPVAQNNILLNVEIAQSIAAIAGTSPKELSQLDLPARLVYPVQRDRYGVQYWIAGDRVWEIITILSNVYGSPKLVQTNSRGQINAAYTVKQMGVALSIVGDSVGTNDLTHITVSEQPPKIF